LRGGKSIRAVVRERREPRVGEIVGQAGAVVRAVVSGGECDARLTSRTGGGGGDLPPA
jgi:hypothetical protein